MPAPAVRAGITEGSSLDRYKHGRGPEEDGVLKDVRFAYDSYQLDGQARDILAANAEWLKENPRARAEIEGHCDERGTIEYNLALGTRRAQAVEGLPRDARHLGRSPLDHQLRRGAAALPGRRASRVSPATGACTSSRRNSRDGSGERRRCATVRSKRCRSTVRNLSPRPRDAKSTGVLAPCLTVLLTLLALAGCATQADIQEMHREQRSIRKQLADTRASVEEIQSDLGGIKGRVEEARYSTRQGAAQRLENIEARLTALEQGQVRAPDAPVGAGAEPGASDPGASAGAQPAPTPLVRSRPVRRSRPTISRVKKRATFPMTTAAASPTSARASTTRPSSSSASSCARTAIRRSLPTRSTGSASATTNAASTRRRSWR